MTATIETIHVPASISLHGTIPARGAYDRQRIAVEHGGIIRGPSTIQGGKPGDDGLEIQVFDAYRFQRELSIVLRRTPGEPLNSRRLWIVTAYRHPGRRAETEVSGKVARALIERIWELTRDHTSLLFNRMGEHEQTNILMRALQERNWNGNVEVERIARETIKNVRPRHEGFVHFHERLLDGYTPSVKLLG